jgi:hypothetical protein
MTFSIEAKRLTDITQPAAGSTCCEIWSQIDLTGPFAAEWADHPRFPWIITTQSWALPEVGAGGPLNPNPLPLALGKFHLNRVSVSPEGCERWVAEIRRDRNGLFSEQAEVEQFIDIDDAAGQLEFFDQDAFAFLFYIGPGFHLRP